MHLLGTTQRATAYGFRGATSLPAVTEHRNCAKKSSENHAPPRALYIHQSHLEPERLYSPGWEGGTKNFRFSSIT